jgi:hypothetical protein
VARDAAGGVGGAEEGGRPGLNERRGAERSHPADSAGLDRVYQHVLLLFLEDDAVLVFADADGVAINDDFWSFRTLWAKREDGPFHYELLPYAHEHLAIRRV